PTLPPSYALSSPLPRPPPPTLFPYTTLFRSGAVPVFAAKAQKHKSRRVAIYVQQAKLTGQQSRHIAAGCAADALLVVAGDDRQEDRKSTRLNSSHVSISYAVFCLKKKKHKKLRPAANRAAQPNQAVRASAHTRARRPDSTPRTDRNPGHRGHPLLRTARSHPRTRT